MSENQNFLQPVIEAAIFAAGEPLSLDKITLLFDESERPTIQEIREALGAIQEFYHDRGVELIEVGSGYRFQAKSTYAHWLQRLWEKKPPRYSRATLETIALIAYRQPITRGEIEEIRGVAVNTQILKTLSEREWIKIVAYKEVPGKPALYATTKQFLDYFNLKSLADLPPLENFVETQLSLNVDSPAEMAAAATPEIMTQEFAELQSDSEDSMELSLELDHASLAEELATPDLPAEPVLELLNSNDEPHE